MGQTMLGGVSSQGSVDLLSPDQKNFLSQLLTRPTNSGQFNDMFQKSFVDPSIQNLQRQIIPTIKENFMGLDSAGSSALNQALAQSATDIATNLGSQQMNQYNQQIGQGLQGLGVKQFKPLIAESDGLLKQLVQILASAGGGYLAGGPAGSGAGVLASIMKKEE